MTDTPDLYTLMRRTLALISGCAADDLGPTPLRGKAQALHEIMTAADELQETVNAAASAHHQLQGSYDELQRQAEHWQRKAHDRLSSGGRR